MGNPNDTTNYIQSLIDNIHTVITNYRDYLGVSDVFKSDDHFIPRYPFITIDFDNSREEWKSMPRRKIIIATFSITYYSSNLNDRNAREGLRNGLSKLSNILRENWDLADSCPDLGTEILSVTPYVLATNEQVVLGGVISLECRKVITVTLV